MIELARTWKKNRMQDMFIPQFQWLKASNFRYLKADNTKMLHFSIMKC
jgi:hypothetical protein